MSVSSTIERTADQATATAEDAADSRWAERIGRFGLGARGSVYCVVAVLALRVAAGGDERTDREGALAAIARQPAGRALLAVLAAGFVAYAAWHVLRAATGRREKGDGERAGVPKRAWNAAVGIGYLALAASTISMVLDGSGSASPGDRQEQTWTARLLSWTFGEWLVGGVALVLVATGVVLGVAGVRQEFADALDLARVRPRLRRWLPRLGFFGYAARGAVVSLIGLFVFRAALQHDPQESVGVDGALHRLAAQPYGPYLLSAVALGLAAFGVYSFVEARWRRVLDP